MLLNCRCFIKLTAKEKYGIHKTCKFTIRFYIEQGLQLHGASQPLKMTSGPSRTYTGYKYCSELHMSVATSKHSLIELKFKKKKLSLIGTL